MADRFFRETKKGRRIRMEKKGSKQLYTKLLFTYTAVLVCVVVALMLYFTNSMRQGRLENNRERMEIMHEEASAYLEECRSIADYLHEDLYKSNMELNDLIHYLTDSPEAYQEYRLDTYASSFRIDYKGMEDFTNQAFEAYDALKRISYVSYSRGDFVYFNGIQDVIHKRDGQKVVERIQNRDLAEEGEFSYVKELRDPITMESVGAMIISFETDRIQEICESCPSADILMYNENGTAAYDSGKKVPVKTVEESRQKGTLEDTLDAYVLVSYYESGYMISYMDKAEASSLPRPLLWMIFGVAVTVILTGACLVRYYLQRVSLRLNRILDCMDRVMDRDLTARLDASKNGDELDVISLQFNQMCEKLDAHIQKSYMAEIEQKNAEMAALQSQINPHFLYNTLEAIRMKAICNGDQEVGKMLYSMAVTFRSQLKEADVITLAQELYYCKKYMELFEYRYPSQFQSSVECPLEYMNVPIIKFVLQPIIENYFIHGIRLREKNNFIKITVEKQGEDFAILVEDNGQGMTEEEIQEKNRQLKENKMDKKQSIGIANVNRRMKAVYGNSYGVYMERAALGGLKVVLEFRAEGGDENDENSNACGG